MNSKLRILILEDRPADAELVRRELFKAGFQFAEQCVATETDFLAALRDSPPDLILADYALPDYDGLSALASAQKECPEAPFIFVSGTIGEETAIEALHSGATDYVLKQRLSRLGPAVRRALRESEQRARSRQAEEALRTSEHRSRILFEYAPDAYYLFDLRGKFVDGNKAAEALSGYRRNELIGKSFLELNLLPPEGLARAATGLTRNAQGEPTGPEEFSFRAKDGNEVTVEIRTYPVHLQGEVLVLGIARDITPRKNAERALAESRGLQQAILDNIPDPAWLKDAQGRFLACNEALAQVCGLKAGEIIGKTAFDIDPLRGGSTDPRGSSSDAPGKADPDRAAAH